ncbi:hypothetical protein JCM21714_2125 [Gracilibacillus boraciitolerans JCM 21714]|uniref:Uncharacterized protein n=1 Tax=Gracilibacillus boraciitolerans JCM 21714 TaxID=1298598 RepID=W4VJT7_9BACI|nr:hypothetical protein [Gracilibacillus boraciitolerans]GAE93088.1 hypothetical protein JCM21714_2125 [Gracilibacillus boraciitolerans JCM 21714]
MRYYRMKEYLLKEIDQYDTFYRIKYGKILFLAENEIKNNGNLSINAYSKAIQKQIDSEDSKSFLGFKSLVIGYEKLIS